MFTHINEKEKLQNHQFYEASLVALRNENFHVLLSVQHSSMFPSQWCCHPLQHRGRQLLLDVTDAERCENYLFSINSHNIVRIIFFFYIINVLPSKLYIMDKNITTNHIVHSDLHKDFGVCLKY